ncbi:MAG: ankyrin repeat domain-containing protein, partial [Syntrophaceae bacterium]|nr:ankyrin repeat domain-containing protein [Syntrophaceae bacterium]
GSSLMVPAWTGQLEILRLLLENKAEVNAKDKHGKTALMLATEQGQVKAIELLKAFGAKD